METGLSQRFAVAYAVQRRDPVLAPGTWRVSVHEIDISCFGVIRGVSGPMEAFLSYTRIDDEFFGGAITSLRRAIELGVQVNTGDRNFKVFQDIDGIELGEKWQERLDEALSSARFLIPIITPLFFLATPAGMNYRNLLDMKKT